MKGLGFKSIKRKEGLQFYLKGFSRGKTLVSESKDAEDEASDSNESTEDFE